MNSIKAAAFMAEAFKEALKSQCILRKTGCLIVKNNTILIQTCNQMDDLYCTKDHCYREEHRIRGGENIEKNCSGHAELRAIALAAKNGVSTNGATIFTVSFPCPWCARAIVFAGIKTVYYVDPYSTKKAETALRKGNVLSIRLEMPNDDPKQRLKYT